MLTVKTYNPIHDLNTWSCNNHIWIHQARGVCFCCPHFIDKTVKAHVIGWQWRMGMYMGY